MTQPVCPCPRARSCRKRPGVSGCLLVFQDSAGIRPVVGRGQFEKGIPRAGPALQLQGLGIGLQELPGLRWRHESPFEPADVARVEAVPATELAQREAKRLSAGPEKRAETFAGGHPIPSFCCIHYTTTEE